MNYEVGKYYNVRCAIVKCLFSDREWVVPVIGFRHEDPQFGEIAAQTHLHIDGRFTPGRYSKWLWWDTDANGYTNIPVMVNPNKDLIQQHYVDRVEIRRRKCRRLTTGVNPPEKAQMYWDWYQAQIGKSCKGKLCPHFGTRMHETDGRLVCPLHGLEGDIDKEIIIEKHGCSSKIENKA